MSSRRAYTVTIHATTNHGATHKGFESYRDAVAFVVGHRAMCAMQTKPDFSLSLYGVEMDKAETLSLVEMIEGNQAYAFNRACAGSKDAECWA